MKNQTATLCLIFVVLYGSAGLYWMADIKMQVSAFDKDASKSIN